MRQSNRTEEGRDICINMQVKMALSERASELKMNASDYLRSLFLADMKRRRSRDGEHSAPTGS